MNPTRDIEQTRLLLVGPDLELLELLEEVLLEEGFDVTAESDMDQVQRQVAELRPDVIVCDEVSGEIDGEALFELLSPAEDDEMAFVLLADDPDGARLARCLDDGFGEYLIKPYDVEELAARLRRIGRQQATRVRLAAQLAGELDEEGKEGGVEARVGFSGLLEFLSLPDLLLNLHQNSQTGRLVAESPEGDYSFDFKKGELVKVRGPRGLEGTKAFYRSVREIDGRFRFLVRDVKRDRSQTFPNLANLLLEAVQEADEYPLTRSKLPSDPDAVQLTGKVEELRLPEETAIRPLLEGLIQSTTIDILIHACPATDLQAAKELHQLMKDGALVEASTAAERAS